VGVISAVDTVEQDIESQMCRAVTTQRSGEVRDGSVGFVVDWEFEVELVAFLNRVDGRSTVEAVVFDRVEVVDDLARQDRR